MPKLPEEVLYDVRLVERNIRKGLLTREQYEEYLKQAEDMTAQADAIDTDNLGGDPDRKGNSSGRAHDA